jgi:hypothetical protein
VFLAVGLVYFLRLSDDKRRLLNDELVALIRTVSDPMSLINIMEQETEAYMKHVKLEDGIARNKALKVCFLGNG